MFLLLYIECNHCARKKLSSSSLKYFLITWEKFLEQKVNTLLWSSSFTFSLFVLFFISQHINIIHLETQKKKTWETQANVKIGGQFFSGSISNFRTLKPLSAAKYGVKPGVALNTHYMINQGIVCDSFAVNIIMHKK